MMQNSVISEVFEQAGPFGELSSLESALLETPESERDSIDYGWHASLLAGRSLTERLGYAPGPGLSAQIDQARALLEKIEHETPDVASLFSGFLEGLAVAVQYGGASSGDEPLA